MMFLRVLVYVFIINHSTLKPEFKIIRYTIYLKLQRNHISSLFNVLNVLHGTILHFKCKGYNLEKYRIIIISMFILFENHDHHVNMFSIPRCYILLAKSSYHICTGSFRNTAFFHSHLLSREVIVSILSICLHSYYSFHCSFIVSME